MDACAYVDVDDAISYMYIQTQTQHTTHARTHARTDTLTRTHTQGEEHRGATSDPQSGVGPKHPAVPQYCHGGIKCQLSRRGA